MCGTPIAPPAPPGAPFLADSLGSHMVLQRDIPARVWGGGVVGGGKVTVTVSGGGGSETQTTTANVNGSWFFDLKTRPATSVPSTLVFTSTNIMTTLTDVLFGDVWGCHGQSNMVFGLGQDINAATECPNTINFPNIRHISYVGDKDWKVPSQATTCTGKGFAPFSAVCWYFGKDVFESLNKTVPVGLIMSAVGGTAIERWSSPDAISKCNQTGVVMQSGLYDDYILPILSMQLSGWTWYQAESNVACSTSWKWMPGLNCGIGCSESNRVCNASQVGCADFYSCQFPAMITDWRSKFNSGTSKIAGRARPFLFVELAPYTEGAGEPYDQSVALVRTAQLAALKLPLVAMAAAYDYGDTASPLGNIHPEYKAIVGQRLSYAARALAYGETIEYKNPVMQSVAVTANQLVITFDVPVTVISPLRGPCPVAPASCAWMTVNGVNVTVMSAGTSSSDVKVTLDSPPSDPIHIEYLQGDWPVPFIYSSGAHSLPAEPFTWVHSQ